MSRTCSQCGNNGHNSRTCTEASSGGCGGGGGGDASGENGIMLFGVRVTEGNSFRKSASMTNLSQFDQQPQDPNVESGYASDDVVHPSGRSRERKRGDFLIFDFTIFYPFKPFFKFLKPEFTCLIISY